LRDLGLRDAADLKMFLQARQPGIVLIGKDSDFVDLVSRFGAAPQLLWVTCGNVTLRTELAGITCLPLTPGIAYRSISCLLPTSITRIQSAPS